METSIAAEMGASDSLAKKVKSACPPKQRQLSDSSISSDSDDHMDPEELMKLIYKGQQKLEKRIKKNNMKSLTKFENLESQVTSVSVKMEERMTSIVTSQK